MAPLETDWADWVRELRASDRDGIDKLRAYFDTVTAAILDNAGRDIEVARAMGDHEAVVKHHIVSETIRTARHVFATGYHVATGRQAWDGDEDRG